MKRSLLRTAVAGFGILTAVCWAPGCHRDSTAPEVSTTPDSAAAAGETDLVAKGGAQVWSENCMRCHNLRPPKERSDRQWEIIVHHMRVRANLTAREHREILAFLKSAN